MSASPEIAAALIGGAAALLAAVITILPAVWAVLRRTRGAVAADGQVTRDAVVALGAQVSAVKDELRADVGDLRTDVAGLAAWQSGHDMAHLIRDERPRGDI